MLTPQQMQKLSPMMKQYFEIKAGHKGQILFYRLGDFYEMFFDDAILVSKELELTLTGRECGLDERAPMCGVPHHACESYIARLIKKGYKVAICEQLESPAQTKGMVRRGVVRVITPGTLIEPGMLDEGSNNYICSVACTDQGFGLAFADISTGEIKLTGIPGGENRGVMEELGRFCPSEIIFCSSFLDKKDIGDFIKKRLACTADLGEDEDYEQGRATEICAEYLSDEYMRRFADKPLLLSALGGLLGYLTRTQRSGLERLAAPDLYTEDRYMNLDPTARQNLELTQTMRGAQRKGSLLWVIDRTRTAMGKRMMKSWVEQPLKNPAAIGRRLLAVEELCRSAVLRGEIRQRFDGIYDLERLLTRIIYGNITPREMQSFGFTLSKLPELCDLIGGLSSHMLQTIHSEIDPLHDVCHLVQSAIDDDPSAGLKEGEVIKEGYDAELDEFRTLSENAQGIMAEMEQREREQTGIKALKIGYNRVFGYYIEVSRSNQDMVPDHYIRKQTLASVERYITEELKTLEDKVLSAKEQILDIESRLFTELMHSIAGQLGRIQRTATAVAKLDVLQGLATVAVENDYCQPTVDLSDVVNISQGRHPVVERLVSTPFVPNDTALDNGEKQIAIITGPNMAGKSTYMRQTAIIVLMAQIGSFVPAKSAHIGVVDGIYTRVGASDDLSTGQSTFMVEMSEVAHILRSATKNSLLILDEIGRGTSTYDGMSIARAVIEYIADKNKLGAKTLFATHYHELTELENHIPVVKNYNTAVKKRGDDITFLRRIVPGGADDSYGIEVSKLAGIPDWVVQRAKEVLTQLEQGADAPPAKIRTATKKKDDMSDQMSFGDPTRDALVERLRGIDENTVSPIEALGILFELKKILGKG